MRGLQINAAAVNASRKKWGDKVDSRQKIEMNDDLDRDEEED